MGSNEAHNTVHELAVGPPRQSKNRRCEKCNDTERVRAVAKRTAPCTNWPSGLPDKAKTAGCRLRFMLEEKRKGKMKN